MIGRFRLACKSNAFRADCLSGLISRVDLIGDVAAVRAARDAVEAVGAAKRGTTG